MRQERSGVDDDTTALRPHDGQLMAHGVQDTIDVGAHDVVIVAVAADRDRIQAAYVAGDTGVVKGNIEPAIGVEATGHQGLHLLLFAHVCAHIGGLPAGRSNGLLHLLAAVFTATAEEDFGTLTRVAMGRRFADA